MCEKVPCVLVVEDDEWLGAVLVELISEDGHTVHRCMSADDALAWLNETNSRPNLILFDAVMPGMLGVEFLHVLRENESLKSLKTCGITGNPDLLVGEVADILVKPCGIDDLLGIVRKHCLA